MIKNVKKLACLVMSIMMIMPSVIFAAGSSVDSLSDDFESALDNWELGASSRNVSVEEDPSDSSNSALEISLPDGGNTSARVMYYDCAPYSKTVNYSWKFMIDPSHSNDSDWETLGVFPANSGSDTPTVGLDYHDGRVIAYIYDSNRDKYIDSKPVRVSKGEWIDLDLQVNWSEDGYIQASIDGQDATDGKMYGPTAASEDGNYLELGVVKESSSNGSSLVYFDDVEIADAFDSGSDDGSDDNIDDSDDSSDTGSDDGTSDPSDSDSEADGEFVTGKPYGEISNWNVDDSDGIVDVVQDENDSSNNVVKFELENGSSARMTYDNDESYGDVAIYKWKFMVDPSHSNDSGWETLGVFPANSGSDAPPVGIDYHDGKAVVFIYDYETGRYTDSKAISIDKGQWVDVELEIKWSKDGYVRAWVDGSEVTGGKMYGPTSVDSNTNCIEWGLVREDGASGKSLVYFDAMDINVIGNDGDSSSDSDSGNDSGTDSGNDSGDTTNPDDGSETGSEDEAQEPEMPQQPDSPAEDGTSDNDSYPNMFYDDFEAGNFNNWDALEDYNGQVGEIVKDPFNSDNYVFKAYTWEGYDRNVRPRAELRVNVGEDLDKEYWYSWKFMIDENFSHDSATEIIGQWHTQPDYDAGESWSNWVDGSFALALEIRPDGQLDFASTPMGIVMKRTGIYPEKGKWHTMTWHIKHSTSNDGFVEAWMDGQPLFDEGKIYGKTSYNNAGSYLKIGSYRYNYTSWTNPGTYASGESCVYYDEVKVSSKMEDVDF